ncbi:MAG TPA: hypothetical protein VIH21_08455, partial [Dehalococcoidia bacterium]
MIRFEVDRMRDTARRPRIPRGLKARHKTLDQLRREQGLDKEARPDYVALASRIWRTEGELREF